MQLTENIENRTFRKFFFIVTTHWELLKELFKREVKEQFLGGYLGTVWLFFHPLFIMAVYIFVFQFVFKNKIGGTYQLPLDYTTYLLSGLIPWLNVQQVLSRSCVAITANAGLVKQVIFPIELLPVKTILATFPSQLVSMFVLLLYVLVTYKYLFLTYLMLPALLLIQTILAIGIAYILSSITVFVRDIKELINLFSFAGMFLLPIAYLPDWVPAQFKPLIYLNPFSYMIWCYQDVFYFGRIEHPSAWIVFTFFAIGVFMFGSYVFNAMKTHFGDAL